MDTAICRVCRTKERVMFNIFEAPPGSSISIADMISQCTGIYISQRPTKTYPTTICRPCMLDAQNAYEFKQTFERSHQYFSQIMDEVCIIPDGDKGTKQVVGGFEILFLDEKEHKEGSFTDQMKNKPTEGPLLMEDQFLVSEVNPSEATDDTNDNATSSAADRPNKCSLCQKAFSRKYDLAIHIRSHTGERPFQCEQCPKSFAKKCILTAHLRTHTGERPFKCSHCPKTFAQKSAQRVHIRLHKGTDDTASTTSSAADRPNKCFLCQKTFSRKYELATHIRIHTGDRPFQCEQCPKSFTKKCILEVHQRTHTGERPFKCSHCPRTFAQKSTQQTHARLHTGERPFVCSECPRSFTHLSHLRYHGRKHTAYHSMQSISNQSNLHTKIQESLKERH